MIRLWLFATFCAVCTTALFPGKFPRQLQTLFENHELTDKILKSTQTKETVSFEIDGLGEVIGAVSETIPSARPMYSFYGLRYGHDPSGDMRFKESSLYETPWIFPQNLQNTFSYHACPQEPLILLFERRGSEDCLRLFIHTPKLATEEGFGDMPVLVWFHGGGFNWGDHYLYQGHMLLDEDDIVVVSVHYRLGILGFLCTHTDEAPGNAGLSDQILALQYIQKYIHNFGGDASKVVIAGESAGGASVSYLMLSNRAEGLFRGVISQSGSALESWALDKKPIEFALLFGSLSGCNYTVNELDELVECIKQLPLSDIMTAQSEVMDLIYNVYLDYSMIPVVEQTGSNPVITKEPEILLRTGEFTKVPVMYGSNLNEGSFMLSGLASEYLTSNNLIDDPEFWKYDSVNLFLYSLGVYDDNNGAADTMTKKYFPGVEMESFDNCKYGAIDMLGVLSFKSGSHYTADFVERFGGDAYSYSFEFDVLGRMAEHLGINLTLPFEFGVTHMLELPFLWPVLPLVTEEFQTLSKKMIKLWTNFIKELNPTPESQQTELEEMGIPLWPTYERDSKPYMKLDESFEIKEDVTQTWMNMMETHYKINQKIHKNKKNL